MLNKRIGKRKVEGSLIVLTDAASPVTVLLDEMEGVSIRSQLRYHHAPIC
jgi:hypothetical protein